MSYKTVTVAAVRAEIKKIGTPQKSLSDRIQQAALACILHAHKHGDVTLAGELTVAVTGGSKVEALRMFFCAYGPMVAEAGNVLRYSKSKKLEGAELDAMMADAEAKLWWDYKTEKPAEDFQFDVLLHALLRKLDKGVEKGFKPSDEEAEVIAMMRKVPAPQKKEAKA